MIINAIFFNIQTGKEKLAEYLKIATIEAKNIIDSFLGTGFQDIGCYIIFARKIFLQRCFKNISFFIHNYTSKYRYT